MIAGENCGSPKVYASGYCKNVRLYPQSQHQAKAKEFSEILNLIEQNPAKSRHIEMLYKQGRSPEDIARKFGMDLLPGDRVQADVLVSEIASEDLNQWSRRSQPLDSWKRMIGGVLDYFNVSIKFASYTTACILERC